MTEQSTNGPVQEAVLEAGVLERGAELSAQMVRPQPAAETTPERTAAELRERLELIREVKRTAMTENVDYGVVPGTEKATLFKPGAEKLALVFKLDVQPSNELIWGPSEHLTVISRATVFHAPTGTRLGYGEGICSSRERNRAYRKQERTCPNCEQPAVIKGKEEFGGGWLCWRKKNGCGAKFPDGDQRIESQEVGEIENPDLPDTWNAVDKMAKKRGYVDAVLSVTGASAIFTQDIGRTPATPRRTGSNTARSCPARSSRPPERPRSNCAAAISSRPRRYGKSSRASSTATCPRRRRAHCYSPLSTRPSQQAKTSRPAARPTVPRSAGPGPRSRRGRRHTDEQAQPASRAETPPNDPASPQSQGDPNAAPAAANEPNTGPPEPNPHGARLRAIANRRGVNDAELANLIRNAVAQGPIPAERARTALPEMLARITEEISEHTIELVEMFHPPSTNTEAATDQTTSVNFGALEPPQAA